MATLVKPDEGQPSSFFATKVSKDLVLSPRTSNPLGLEQWNQLSEKQSERKKMVREEGGEREREKKLFSGLKTCVLASYKCWLASGLNVVKL